MQATKAYADLAKRTGQSLATVALRYCSPHTPTRTGLSLFRIPR